MKNKDIMTFLETFKEAMEIKIEKSTEKMEGKIEQTNIKLEDTNRKIDSRLDTIDSEILKMKEKMDCVEDKSDSINKRMEERMGLLEKEMRRSAGIQKKSEMMRNTLRENENRKDENEQVKVTGFENRKQKDLGRMNKQTKEDGRQQMEEPQSTQESQNGGYRSLWAKEMERELKIAAERPAERIATKEQSRINQRSEQEDKEVRINQRENFQDVEDRGWSNRNESPTRWQEDREIPNNWDEILTPAPRRSEERSKLKIRKPVEIKTWFGDVTSTEESESDTEGWNEIDRRKRNEQRRRRLRRKKQEKKTECARRAATMVGIGPISREKVMEEFREHTNYEEAKIIVLKSFLAENLGYDEKELEELKVAETKFASKGENVLNIALYSEEQTKELHIRKAESQNDRITVRNYIPPNFYETFMFLNRICTQKRAENVDLKTQLRFGRSDIEIYTKTRGENTGFKPVKSNDFTDVTLVPQFDYTMKWRRFEDKPPRRKVHYQQKQKQTTKPGPVKPLARSNSNSVNNDNDNKKQRMDEKSSESSSGEEEDEEEEVVLMEDDPLES